MGVVRGSVRSVLAPNSPDVRNLVLTLHIRFPASPALIFFLRVCAGLVSLLIFFWAG
ncbi:hypothetical protein BDW02DRAFT_62474 [Decorospora gaudefroyi]|uniref:Uncharacterized protein n=1 Tax=Decorospora gaudefroyi TaxID=184978 RepID=A0A6A5K540_9PLEO|nr:hypothetical protein BDW02DRAFT_62474 [Decorospora gaudefroyi]